MHRRVSFRIRDMNEVLPADAATRWMPFQSSAASLGLFYSRRASTIPINIVDAVMRLIAKIPTMVAAYQLIRKGQESSIQPRERSPLFAHFPLHDHRAGADPSALGSSDACLIPHARAQASNASTFSARVTASNPTAPTPVVASAVEPWLAPLHGGANADVFAMARADRHGNQVEPYLDRAHR